MIAEAAQPLIAKLPPVLRNKPNARALVRDRRKCVVDMLHLLCRSKHDETQSKDDEFLQLSMHEPWHAGRTDMPHTLRDPRWLAHDRHKTGAHRYDLTAGSPVTPPAA